MSKFTLITLLIMVCVTQGVKAQSVTDEKQVKRLLTIYNPAMAMDWNADGSLILTSEIGFVRLWDAQTLKQLYSVNHGQVLNGLQFNAKGDRFVTWSNSAIRMWDTASGHLIGSMKIDSNTGFEGVEWWDDQIVDLRGGVIGLWDGTSLENTYAVLVPNENFHTASGGISWNKDRTRFLTWNEIYTSSPEVRVWTIPKTLKPVTQIMTLPHSDYWIDGASWSPDEMMIASWSQKMVRVWDAKTGELLHVINDASYVGHASWSPNSLYLLVEDIQQNKMRVWDAHSGKEIRSFPGTDAMWDTTGERLLVGRVNLSLVDVTTGQELATFGKTFGLGIGKWHSDGIRFLTISGASVQVWVIPPEKQCVIQALKPATLRVMPSSDSDRVDVLPPHQLITVIGQKMDDKNFRWWELEGDQWVRSHVVQETGACSSLGL